MFFEKYVTSTILESLVLFLEIKYKARYSIPLNKEGDHLKALPQLKNNPYECQPQQKRPLFQTPKAS